MQFDAPRDVIDRDHDRRVGADLNGDGYVDAADLAIALEETLANPN